MLSRVADSIYWMGRYVERAENLARFIDVTLNLLLDSPQDAGREWAPLVNTTGDDEYFAAHYGEPNEANVIRFLAFDREYPNSIIASLAAARENARTVREAISSEAWEQLNEFYLLVRNAAGSTLPPQPVDFFGAVKQHSHLFNGVLDATMSHDKGWHFANLGRLLERADKTSRILDVKYFTLLPHVEDVGTTLDDLQWSAVLRSVSGFEMYRKRHHAITVRRVVQFLILDRAFPRAARFCISGADESLHEICNTAPGTYCNAAQQRLGRLRSELDYTDVDSIVQNGLHEYIDRFQDQLNAVGEAINETFFAAQPVTPTQVQTQR